MSARPAIVHTLKPPRVGIGPADTSAQLHPPINQTTSAPEKPRYVRTKAPAWLSQVLAPLIGLALFVAVWAILAKAGGRLPDPVSTWHSAIDVFSNPFYKKGPNDQGIGWNVLTSLGRVGIGFGMAALVGIPLGFMLGRFRFLSDMAAPIISILKPVSPLAWLPIGLMVFKAANPAAIYVIFICSLWPMIVNTAVGVRLSIGVAWLVIVAAEMLTGGVGIGFWVWDEWNNLNVQHIIIAIFTVGIVGLALEQSMILLAHRFSYD